MTKTLLGSLGILAGALFAVGCKSDGLECGPGTMAVEGQCVPSVTCGPGTKPEGGECVPDGSLICAQGTVYDPATGACVPDANACAEGTVLINGQCVPDDDALTADLEEAAEPNGFNEGDNLAGTIDVSQIGEENVTVIHGCINPFEDLLPEGAPDGENDADLDLWLLTGVNEPTILEITADGVGGLAAGFLVIPADPSHQDLVDHGWQRFGVNLTGDTSKRQVYLPKGGAYGLAMGDSRSFFLAASGSPEACYYATIKKVPMPAVTPITNTITTGTMGTDPLFFSMPVTEGALLDATLVVNSSSASESIVSVHQDGYKISAIEVADLFGTIPAGFAYGGLKATDQVTIVVDNEFNFALAPVGFTLDIQAMGAVALPADGSEVQVPVPGATFNTLRDLGYAYFDVAAADDIVHFDLGFSKSSSLMFVDADLFIVGEVVFPGDPEIDEFQGFVRFAEPGRYYVIVNHEGETGDIGITSTRATAPVTPLVIGTPASDVAPSALGADFFSLDADMSKWLAFNAGGTNLGGDVRVAFFNAATAYGVLDEEVFPAFSNNFLEDGSETIGRITSGEAVDYLALVEPLGTLGMTPSFDVSAAVRTFTDVGAVGAMTPFTKDGETITAGSVNRYFATVTAGDQVTIKVTPTGGLNASIRVLNRTEGSLQTGNTAGVDAVETLVRGADATGFIAFEISGAAGTAGTYKLEINAKPPRPYVITNTTLPFTPICPSQMGTGVVVAQTAVSGGPVGDEAITAVQTMPFAFEFFGDAVTQYQVLANGFLSFDPALPQSAFFSNSSTLPNTANPNMIVAPYWDDLQNIEICKLETATEVTIEWRGDLFDDPGTLVEFQVVLRSNGVIDLIYGDDQQANGASATVGVENGGGLFGHAISINAAGITASTSKTLTPM